MELLTACKYAEYLLFSRHRKGHGIHSPFVYNLVVNIFRNKISRDIVFNIESIRKKLTSSSESLIINDLGSGSFKSGKGARKISDIAEYSAVPEKYGMLLSNLATWFGGSAILELGTSLGISTMYMASSCRDAVVYTVEGSDVLAEIASANFDEAGLGNIRLYKGSFDTVLPLIKSEGICPGLVFIDGDHRKEPLLRYFEMILEMTDDKSVVVIDDIYYSGEMADAWKEIRKCPRVSVTIDLFRMGLVFFTEGLTRCDYVIRY